MTHFCGVELALVLGSVSAGAWLVALARWWWLYLTRVRVRIRSTR